MTNADIQIPSGWDKEEYPSICYSCSHTRKKENQKKKCLSVRARPKGEYPIGTYHCTQCGEKGIINQHKTMNAEVKPQYEKPSRRNFTKLSDEVVSFFAGRGITQEVLIANKIVEENGWAVYPYIVNGELVNVKKRNTKSKDFRQSPGAKAVMWNYDRCIGQKAIITCEGEDDAMAFEVAGFTNHTTVNQGAPNVNDKNIDKKLECITNCYELFEQADLVYIAVDKDENGQRLEQELIRRIGSEKCRIVEWDHKYKDARELLLFEGKEALQEAVKNAKEVRVDGIYYQDDVRESMLHTFRNGKKKGTTTYFPTVDARWKWRTGELNLWTGYNNEGKSLKLLQLCLVKAIMEGWKTAVFSPENVPVDEFYDDLIHTYVGKSTDKYDDNCMSEREYLDAMNFMQKHFFVVYPDKDFTIDTIEEKLKYLIRKQGVRICIVDPYNQVEHLMKNGEREDLYISRFMARLTRFCRESDVSYHLVAHQNTPQKDTTGNYPKPSIYAIKGGGTFGDKADNVLVVHRPYRATNPMDTSVDFYSDKIKKQRLVGLPGHAEGLSFDRKTNRYICNGVSPVEYARFVMEKTQTPVYEQATFIQDEPATEKSIHDAHNLPASDFEKESLPFEKVDEFGVPESEDAPF